MSNSETTSSIGGTIVACCLVLMATLLFVGGLVYTIRAGQAEERELMKNRDPRVGPVYNHYERPRTYWYCNGTDLVYKSQVRGGLSVAVSPNSPECVS